MSRGRAFLFAILLLAFLMRHVSAQDQPQAEDAAKTQQTEEKTEADAKTKSSPDDDLLNLDIEQLRQTKVSSPALEAEVTAPTRTKTSVKRTAAAVYVITNEMIRRSGARNIPEALRMAPGVNVARVHNSKWAISIRGANAQRSTKLLVQIDGRDVYTPTFSGVQWDQERLLLKPAFPR